MKIKEMAIDRYGAWSKLRLSDLDDRLNVVYGGNGSGKTTVVRFLQAMLYGFPHFQESAAPAQSSPWGGSVTVESRQGRCVIRRHDNGTRTGRLAVIELKASSDLHLPMQALDYWARVKWHIERGEFGRSGYFPGLQLRPEPPRLLLVAPALEFHPTTETILRYFAPDIDVERIGLALEWRTKLQVMFRAKGAACA